MPRRISAAALTALQTNEIITRDFIYINVKEWDTDISRVFYYWSGIDNISAKITNPLDKTIQTHVFEGAGQLLEIEDISGGSGIVVRTLQISLAAVDDAHTLMRTYNAKLAPVIIWRGLMNAGGETLVTPAIPRFTGYVDQVEIIEGKDGVPSGISATCVSEMITLLKTFPFTRSDQYQRERSASDSFRMHAATIGNRELFWGSVKGKLPAEEESTESTGAKSEDVQTFTSGGGGDNIGSTSTTVGGAQGRGTGRGPSTASTGTSRGGAQGRGTERGPSTESTGTSKGGAQGRGTERGSSTASTGSRGGGEDIDANAAENRARAMQQMDEQAIENERQGRGGEDVDADEAENRARAMQQMDEQAVENERQGRGGRDIDADEAENRARARQQMDEQAKENERIRVEAIEQRTQERLAAERDRVEKLNQEAETRRENMRKVAEQKEQDRQDKLNQEAETRRENMRKAAESRGSSTTSKGGAQGRGTERGPSTASTGTSKGGAQGRGTERGPSTASTGGGKGSSGGSSSGGSGASRGGSAGDGTRGGGSGSGGSSGGGSSGGEGPGWRWRCTRQKIKLDIARNQIYHNYSIGVKIGVCILILHNLITKRQNEV